MVSALRASIEEADRTRAANSGSWQELARLLVALRQAQADLACVIDATIADLYKAMPRKRMELEDVGIVERTRIRTRSWKSQELLWEVVRRALDPEGDGTIPDDPLAVMQMIVDAITKTLPVRPSLEWRLTGLSSLGIDPDEWSETRSDKPGIRVIG